MLSTIDSDLKIEEMNTYYDKYLKELNKTQKEEFRKSSFFVEKTLEELRVNNINCYELQRSRNQISSKLVTRDKWWVGIYIVLSILMLLKIELGIVISLGAILYSISRVNKLNLIYSESSNGAYSKRGISDIFNRDLISLGISKELLHKVSEMKNHLYEIENIPFEEFKKTIEELDEIKDKIRSRLPKLELIIKIEHLNFILNNKMKLDDEQKYREMTLNYFLGLSFD